MNRTSATSGLIVVLLLITGIAGSVQALDLSGRCYSGQKPDESNELQGVPVTLYGAAEEGGTRTQLDTDTTASNGWYGLTVEEGYEHYFIVAGSVLDYSFQSASSVSGTVSGNEIHYSTASAPLSEQTSTGNKFWYTSNAPQNNPPVANDDSATTPQDTPVDIDVLTNDNDPDLDTLHINSTTDPPHGTTTNHGTHVTYAPDAGFTGTDTFDYIAGDGKGGTDTATVTVTVVSGEEPPTETGTIRGVKFNDLDGNGQRDPEEPGISGWQIELWMWENGDFWDWTHIATAGTDASGEYSFENLSPGEYQIREESRSDWTQTYPGGHHTVSFETSQIIEGLDFGNHETGAEPPEGTRTIRGMKYNDLNSNGQKGVDEPGLPGWTIFLDLNDNGSYDEGEPQTTVKLSTIQRASTRLTMVTHRIPLIPRSMPVAAHGIRLASRLWGCETTSWVPILTVSWMASLMPTPSATTMTVRTTTAWIF